MNYERNKLYFIPGSFQWKPQMALICICIILLIFADKLPHEIQGIIGGLAVISIIGCIIWIAKNSSNSVVTDAEYDNAVNDKFKNIDIMQTALEKIGLDEDQVKEIPSVYFNGFRIDKNALEKIGRDGKLRTSMYDITVLFFSETQVFMYQQVFDMIKGTKLENTQEYFYKDIVSFSTSTKSSEKDNDTKGVSTFLLIVPNDEFYCSMNNVSDSDGIIFAMKQKLREKKS